MKGKSLTFFLANVIGRLKIKYIMSDKKQDLETTNWGNRPSKLLGNITLQLPAELVVPILKCLTIYIDGKYPCDTDSTCGDNMPIEDIVICHAHNFLALRYNKNKQLLDEVCELFVSEIAKREGLNKTTKSKATNSQK